jgi:hypothetical protein
MELYKNINNEALDEDLKAKRTVLERLRKNYGQIDEEVLSKVELSKESKVALTKSVLSLNASIDDIFLKSADRRIKEKYNLGDIPYKYNLMATYIMKNLGYRQLDDVDKSFVNENVDKLIPKLQSLNELANENEFLDAFLVPKIIDNIKSRQFNTLVDLPEIQNRISEFTKSKAKSKPKPDDLPTLEDLQRLSPKKRKELIKKYEDEFLEREPAGKKGRPRKYGTQEESYQAKLESTRRSRARAKEASKLKTPAQAEIDAENPEDGNIKDDLDEEDEDEDEDYDPFQIEKQIKGNLKDLRKQFKSGELPKDEYDGIKNKLVQQLAQIQELLV